MDNMLNTRNNLTEGLSINKKNYNKRRALTKQQYILYAIGIIFLIIMMIVAMNVIRNMIHNSKLKKRNNELQKKVVDNKYGRYIKFIIFT